MVNGRAGVWLGAHQGSAEGGGFVDDGGLPVLILGCLCQQSARVVGYLSDHAFCLAMACLNLVRFAEVNRSRGLPGLLRHVLMVRRWWMVMNSRVGSWLEDIRTDGMAVDVIE